MQQKGCMKTYWAYMLLCADGSFYIGVTNDLEYRVNQHKFGFDPKCYTFKRRPVELVYSADFHHIDEAIACEKRLKGWSRAKKMALIENDWPLISRLARNYWGRLCGPSALVALRQAQGDKGPTLP
jgi:putative endonuclease